MKDLIVLFVFALAFGFVSILSLFYTDKLHSYYKKYYAENKKAFNPFRKYTNSYESYISLKVLGLVAVLISIFLFYQFFIRI